MTDQEFQQSICADIQRRVAAAQVQYEHGLNDDDTYVIDEATRTVVRDLGRVRWPLFGACPVQVEDGQVALKGMQAKYYIANAGA